MKPASLKGFTLIELLIVVAIIAILAAIAVPNFLEAQTRAKVSRNKADMRTLATALESYAVDEGKYPPAWEAFSTGVWASPSFGMPFHSRIPSWITTPVAYVTSLPVDPFRSNDVTSLTPPLDKFITRHIYFNLPYHIQAAPTSLNFQNATRLAGQWLMYSVGPDRQEFNTPPGGSTLGIRVYRDYDTTNGTISLGNIFRTQANGDKLGTDPYFYTTP